MKIASIDIGLKRIGLALCLQNNIVIPKEPILRRNRNQAAIEVKEFLDFWEIEHLVVGLPKGGSSEEEMEKRIKHFVSLIRFDKDIVYIDEYGSSKEAEEMTKGVFKQRRDGKIDSVAAKIILERYLTTKYPKSQSSLAVR
jgi:putative Holliday junction resolvase